MVQNKIVVHFQDGRVVKGYSNNFMPNKEIFHITPMEAAPDSKPVEVYIRELKAIFFVKDFVGNSKYQEKKTCDPDCAFAGRKILVTFKDGETMMGTTQGYQPGRPGFFVLPADPRSNNERCFVVSAATQKVSFV